MTDLAYLSAKDAIAAFTSRSLSPVELMDATLARAEAVEPTINAFTYTYFDQARDAAKAAEARYAVGSPMGPLDGLPIGIKDESMIAGQPTSNGSLLMRDFVPDETSVVNQRILDAGGIVHARTATPEFSCAGFTWSRLWGVTRNPWNPDMTPGGSSGGTAASLAAGTSSIATGSDIGGSIRIPASTCGLVGYKPPYGRNPDDPPFNLDFFCHTGPLARTVSDAILLQNVMSGPTPRDIASLPKMTIADAYPPISGWKIAYSPDLGSFQVDDQVRANTEAALDVFRDLGATVEEVDIGWGSEVPDACWAYLKHLFGAYLGTLAAGQEDQMTPYCRAFAEAGAKSSAAEFVGALEVIGKMYETLGPILQDHNLLVTPTTGLPAVPADFDQSSQGLEINGKPVAPELGWVLTTPFNAMSRCPVLQVPTGHAENGVPTGLQIVGRTYADADVFQAGLAFEAAVGGWFKPDARPSL